MRTCNNCLHNDFCNVHGYIDADECGFFKNKADYVEVVRCGKCRYRTEVTECNHTLYFCRKKQNYIKLNDFCSYGVRKEEK